MGQQRGGPIELRRMAEGSLALRQTWQLVLRPGFKFKQRDNRNHNVDYFV